MDIIPGDRCPVCYGLLADYGLDDKAILGPGRKQALARLRRIYEETRTCPRCEQSLPEECGPILSSPPTDLGKLL